MIRKGQQVEAQRFWKEAVDKLVENQHLLIFMCGSWFYDTSKITFYGYIIIFMKKYRYMRTIFFLC